MEEYVPGAEEDSTSSSSLGIDLEDVGFSLIDLCSVLRLNIESHPIPSSMLSFESGSVSTNHLDKWAKFILRYHHDILMGAQIVYAIHGIVDLSITCDRQLSSVLLTVVEL